MLLSDENIVAFQKIYKNRFGKEINKEDAYEKGVKLLRLMSIVYRPMTKVELKTTQLRKVELLQKNKQDIL